MVEGLASSATAPPVPVPKVAATSPAIVTPDRTDGSAPEKTPQKTANHPSEVLRGFNPALSIDPNSHVVVMTFSGPDGKVLQQIPNKQQLAAYNANTAKH